MAAIAVRAKAGVQRICVCFRGLGELRHTTLVSGILDGSVVGVGGMPRGFILLEHSGDARRRRMNEDELLGPSGVENQGRATAVVYRLMPERTSSAWRLGGLSFLSMDGSEFAKGTRRFRSSADCLREDGFISRSGRRLSIKERVANRKKRFRERNLQMKAKQTRSAIFDKARMSHEQKLRARIEKAQRNIAEEQRQLERFKLPPLPETKHDSCSLTAEELNYLQRVGRKHGNYIAVGRRGIFGGVVQNMHLHWKKHLIVKLDCGKLPRKEVENIAEQLARLSGGIVADVQDGNTVIMYRGKHYSQPENIIPENTLSKRKALLKSKHEQALKTHTLNIEQAEQELRLYYKHMAEKRAKVLPPKDACSRRDPNSSEKSYPESELISESDSGPEIVCGSNFVPESGSDWATDEDSSDTELEIEVPTDKILI